MNREEPPEMKKAALDQWVREQENCGELGQREIRQIQLQKLNALLKREKGRQGFYRNLPEHLASLEQLPELPLTTEEDLKRSGNGMVLVSQSAVERVRTQETSGTTGPAKRVFYTAGDNERTVSFFAAGLSELIHPGSRTMICMPFSGDRGLGELIAEAVTRLGAEPLPGGWDRTFGAFLDLLEKEQPDTFVGPPVLLLSLLRLQPESSLKRALVSGDACPAGVMSEIEKLLDSRLYPHYGSREMGLGGAVACPAFAGMHLRENDILAEILDEEGRPLPPGEWGELVITTLEAEAMPLIRYRTGDRTRFLPDPCPCGSSLARLDAVHRKGTESRMEDLDDLLFRHPEVVDYQAFLEKDRLRIRGFVTGEIENLPEHWRGTALDYQWKQISREDRPCCRGKRGIRTER